MSSDRNSLMSRFWSKSANKWVFSFLMAIVLLAIFGPLFSNDPRKVDLFNTLQKPFGDLFYLGTDELGRDLLSGLIQGLGLAIKIGLMASGISFAIGSSFGLISTYYGDNFFRLSYLDLLVLILSIALASFYAFQVLGVVVLSDLTGLPLFLIRLFVFLVLIILPLFLSRKVSKKLNIKSFFFPLDSLTGRLIELFNAIPKLILILAFAMQFDEPSAYQVAIILGLTSWTNIARLTRGEVLKVKYLEFIEFAKSSGLSNWRIIWRYIFPNTLTPVLISIAFTISGAVLFEATLSFLGLGVPVEEVSLGNLLMQGKRNMDAWWLVVFPGSFLFLLVLSLNLLGRGLSNALNKD